MSRIGKKPVAIPAGVEVKFENGVVFVKGPKGELAQPVDENLVSVVVEDGNVIVSRDADSKEERSAHGLYRTLIHNMILGVSEGFEKKLEMVHVKELLGLTGYVRGGCSPIGMKKKYPTLIDETAQLFDRIYVSAGMRGHQIIVAPDALAKFVEAKYADLTK